MRVYEYCKEFIHLLFVLGVEGKRRESFEGKGAP